jgi:hypothetical protein
MSVSYAEKVRQEAFTRMLHRRIAALQSRVNKAYNQEPQSSDSRSESCLEGAERLLERNSHRAPVRLEIGPPEYRLSFHACIFTEAFLFFRQWKLTRWATLPTDEAHLQCLIDADNAVPLVSYYPRDEFVIRVSENFDIWKLGK